MAILSMRQIPLAILLYEKFIHLTDHFFSGDSLKSICNGVAGNTSTQGVQMSTVFRYLRQTDPEYCSNWLDATLYAVYKHGDEDTLDYFIENQRDTPIHAAVRFSLITGISLSILCMLGKFT